MRGRTTSKVLATYSPTPTNQHLVRKLESLVPLRFQPLEEDIIRRVAQLSEVQGRTIHLWGDGEKHHESYFVTRGKVRFKINIDRHSDRMDARYIDFTNHITASQKDGIVVATQINKTDKLDDARKRAVEFDGGEIGVSVDLDGVDEMPVLERWLFPYNMGLYGWEIRNLLVELHQKTRTLDVGGLIETIPDFSLVSVARYDVSYEDMYRFLEIIKQRAITTTGQEIVDKVMSKTTENIASFIRAFLTN
ncbi:MAG: hypothetical protein ABH842_03380 [Candidatus Micrarchaeota archaeon]